MSFTSWLKNVRFALGPIRAERKRRRQRSIRAARPHFEVLEDRTVPAFLAPVSYPVAPLPYGAVATGDFNGDARLDLAVHRDDSTNQIGILLGNGDGTFQAPRYTTAGRAYGGPQSLAAGDFNADGRLDLATANGWGFEGTVSVLLGNGDGTFGAARTLLVADFSDVLSVAVGDLNADGRSDLVVGARLPPEYHYPDGGPYLYVLLGNGDGTFASPDAYPLPQSATSDRWPYSVQLGDFNGDAKLDAVTANRDNTVSVLLGNGDGTLQTPTNFETGPGPTVWSWSVAVADLNADGKLDLATADYNGTTVSVLLGSGTGAFPVYQTYAVGDNPASVAVADVNGDGRHDLVTANSGSHNVSALLGNGDGTFQTTRNYPAGTSPWSTAVGSFNGDSFPDVAVTNSAYPSTVSVLINDGNWSPSGPPSIRISDVAKAEGQKGSTYFVFTVTLSASYDAPVTVNFATANGTAKTSDNDYVATSGTLTFAPGETTKTITVLIKGDRRKEANETFFVNLSGAVNALIADAQGVGTILNDD